MQVTLVSMSNVFMKRAFMFFDSEVVEARRIYKNLKVGYFEPFLKSMIITDGTDPFQENCHIIAAPAENYEDAKALMQKHDFFE